MMNTFNYTPLNIELKLCESKIDVPFCKWRNEFWKPLKDLDYPYLISSHGRVRSMDREVNNRFKTYIQKSIIMSQFLTKGYLRVALRKKELSLKGGKQQKFLVHRLMGMVFLPKSSTMDDMNVINHKDSIKTNNHISNLEWVSHLENICHYLCESHNSPSKMSKYIGVYYVKKKKRWQVKLKNKDGKYNYRNFISQEDAYNMYTKNRLELGIANRYTIVQ